jgi:polysaccharide export outer membrane protein
MTTITTSAGSSSNRSILQTLFMFVILLGLLVSSGCQTKEQFQEPVAKPGAQPQAIALKEGDTLLISFPGTPNLDTPAQQIRRDGNITLPLIGEVKAAGKTPAQLEKELLDRYSPQLVSKQVTVTVQSSSFVVYVTGAVLKPGKVTADHPLTALEAVMEAGGPDYAKANLKAVAVTRMEGGQFHTYTLNLKIELEGGRETRPFYLKPADIVKVPERFTMF